MRSARDPLDDTDPPLFEDGCAAYVGCQHLQGNILHEYMCVRVSVCVLRVW